MNTITKRILNVILVFLTIIFLAPQNVYIASAATNAAVYEYSPILEDGGSIYYIQTVEGDDYTYEYDIYRLEVATSRKTKLISSENGISGMLLHNDTLYYACDESGEDIYQTHTYSVSIDGKDKKTICSGRLICLDDSSIYYTVIKEEVSKLYKRNYDSKKATLIYTGNMTFSFAKKLDNTLYFTQFKESTSKLTIYTLKSEQTKLAVLTTNKIKLDGSERSNPTVSDIVEINGDIYYQYGVIEGTGDYWYGTLIKLDPSTNTKSAIAKQTYEEQIYHNDNSVFYNGTDGSGEHYEYNTKTGKTTSYIYKAANIGASFNILGDKTYCAKADGKELITVFRYTSGTDKENLVESFINISYKQEKKYDYSTRVTQYGDYLLIPVTCRYYDPDNGWRGRIVSVTWYIADSDGKILAQFQ
jgi:hypothetical protein